MSEGADTLTQLTRQIAQHPDNEELLLRRAQCYWQRQDIPRCMADYEAALRINPQSRARHLKAMAQSVMEYYYKDSYNP